MQQAFGWSSERRVDSRMLYIFAGFPGKQLSPGTSHLHAGGMQHLIEKAEKLAMLEHNPAVQYRKEGVFNAVTNGLIQPISNFQPAGAVPIAVPVAVGGFSNNDNTLASFVPKSFVSASVRNSLAMQSKADALGTNIGLDGSVHHSGNSAIVDNISRHSSGSFHSSFISSPNGDGIYEPDYPTECKISDACLRDGITWDWFPEKWSFGNGITIHKTLASPEFKTVVHGTDLSLEEFLAMFGPTRLGELELERNHIRTEGWEKYEARWLPGTCPQENHVVHLTWLVTKHPLSDLAYERIKDIIEGAAEPGHLEQYSQEEGRHFSVSRRYEGKPAHGGMA